MRFHRLFVALVMVCAPLLAWGQGTGLESIRKAGSASEAVAAYARALGASADPTLAQQAYITRMIELKNPALAEEQAKEVTQWVNDGQAWAVLAFVDAQNDRIEPALERSINAVKYSPSNEFAQTTAGQIVAWYDVRDDQAVLPESVKGKADLLRKLSDRNRIFSRAYESAKRILTEGVPEEYDGGMAVNIVGSLEELGTYSGYTTSNVPGLVSYWSNSYMYPGYDLEPWWADYNYNSYWAFPPVRLRNVSRDVRYIRMPGESGFLLVDGLGATVVPTSTAYWRNPYYAWQRDPWYVYNYSQYGPRYAGRYPAGAPMLRGYGVLQGSVPAPGYGYGYGYGLPSYGYGYGGGLGYGGGYGYGGGFGYNALGTSRLAQRMGNPIAFPGMLTRPPGLGALRSDGPAGGGGRGGGGRGGRGGGRGRGG